MGDFDLVDPDPTTDDDVDATDQVEQLRAIADAMAKARAKTTDASEIAKLGQVEVQARRALAAIQTARERAERDSDEDLDPDAAEAEAVTFLRGRGWTVSKT